MGAWQNRGDMRLTCPNCSARYEVDDAMIPPDGRDVQCSNCSTTWFQPGPRPAREEVVEEHPGTDEADVIASEPRREPAPEPEAGMREAAEPAGGPAGGDVDEPAPDGRRPLDPAVRDLLREEAEREERLRAGGDGVETQDEMPLESAAPEGSAERAARDAVLSEADENFEGDLGQEDAAITEAVAATMAGGSRRDLLPDIEEINSTLRATGDRSAGEDASTDIETIETRPRRRNGVRLGFGLVLLIAAGLILAYANAPALTDRFPQAGPTLLRYVETVDDFRVWIDELAQGALPDSATGDE